ELGFIIFNLINLILNILISIILYKLILKVRGTDHEKDDRRVILYICLFLIGIPQLFNYVLGQINLYVTLLILLSLYIFITNSAVKYQFLASIILGISIIIKPTTIFMIPFILIIGYDYKKRRITLNFRKSVLRLIGIALPLALNILMFLIYPDLLNGFIATNFTGSETVLLNHSFSITKLISNAFLYFGVPPYEMNATPIFLGVLLIIGVLGFMLYVLRRPHTNSLIFGYLFGILIMFLAYFDTWDHHMLQITPLLILALFNLPRDADLTRKYIKPGFFFLNFFGLLFTGVFMLTMPFFPFNLASTVFLILIFIGISIHCLRKQNDGSNN
ncbi:MAG: glycosyltransferase 87 family protein, partial [Candidatus Hermodarchaeota archaeon]